MSSDIVIRAEGLGKQYLIAHQVRQETYLALRDVIAQKAAGIVRSLVSFERNTKGPTDVKTEEFWALTNVSFEVRRGEVIGIIGRNGAGKSTLLKILSRITEPSEGRVTIKGRVASLLEVGTGFHPELTGRENIFLNGAILGMTRAEIRKRFDEIVAFAEVEKFLDTPVKRYSSGMYVRLAFAVAAHLEADILIVDEVLAVGDAAFQKKCLGRMEDVSASGRTVLFVSHNIGSLVSICQSGLLLEAGKLSASGDIRSVTKTYHEIGNAGASNLSLQSFHGPLKDLRFQEIELNGSPVLSQIFAAPCDELVFRIRGVSSNPVPNFRFAFSLFFGGVRVFTVHDGPEPLLKGPFTVTVRLPRLLLRPGDYVIGLGGFRVDGQDWVWLQDIAIVTITEEWGKSYDSRDIGIINLPNSIVRDRPFEPERKAVGELARQ
jgi:lipopolysaccharide transport system ATP-binding protein